MYFTKLNVREEKSDGNQKELNIDFVLNEIFNSIGEEKVVVVKEKKKINNENTETLDDVEKKFRYKFLHLIKNEEKYYICGRVAKLENKSIEILDDNQIREQIINDKIESITFYFDFKTEMITFITRQSFGYKQFNDIFTLLLEEHIGKERVELELETNLDKVDESIKNFTRIDEFSVTLTTPPNGKNNSMRKILENEQKESFANNIGKIFLKYLPLKKDDGIKITSDVIKKYIVATTIGYGVIEFLGERKDGTIGSFNSRENAPYTVIIPDSKKFDLEYFQEISEKEIVIRQVKKNRAVEDLLKEQKKELKNE